MKIVYKLFTTPTGYYLYDRFSNVILKLGESEYAVFKDMQINESFEDNCAFLKKYQKKGILGESIIEKIEHPALGNLDNSLRNDLKQIILQVTQNCNFRCGYCSYSGSYFGRTHTAKRMSLETAKEAIDFAMKHSNNFDDNFSIGFYGGEPLLEKDLIKKCIQYVKDHYPEKSVTYTITTNASLMDEETMDLFYNNGFSVNISLDGPEEAHDRERRMSDNSGSFKIVMKNLQKFKEKYPDYYSQRVGISSVTAPTHDFGKTIEFFREDALVNSLFIRFNIVEDTYSKKEIKYSEEFKSRFEFEYMKLLLSMLEKIRNEDVSNLIAPLYGRIRARLKLFLPAKGTNPINHHAGPCVPGIGKIFVDVDGNFYPCEKLSESEDTTKIGDLKKGYDMNKIAEVVNIGTLTEDECKDCWNLYFCDVCLAKVDDIKSLSREKKLLACEESKKNAMLDMKTYCLLKHYNYGS